MVELNDDNKNLIKILLENKTKPDLSNYSYEELYKMCINFDEDKKKYLPLLNYSLDTVNLLNEIFINNKFTDINLTNIKTINDKIYDLWKKIPLLSLNGDLSNCVICLDVITNNNLIIFKCEHMTHSSCFFDYLFSNLKKNSKDFIKLLKCPNCRNYLTDEILKYSNEYDSDTNFNDNDNDNIEFLFNENNVQVEEQYGDESNNFILREYNLIENTINNYLVNNLFRTYNVNQNDNITNNFNNIISNVIVVDDYDNYGDNYNQVNSDNDSSSDDSSINSDD